MKAESKEFLIIIGSLGLFFFAFVSLLAFLINSNNKNILECLKQRPNLTPLECKAGLYN